MSALGCSGVATTPNMTVKLKEQWISIFSGLTRLNVDNQHLHIEY
jgi:hypothetical protein